MVEVGDSLGWNLMAKDVFQHVVGREVGAHLEMLQRHAAIPDAHGPALVPHGQIDHPIRRFIAANAPIIEVGDAVAF